MKLKQIALACTAALALPMAAHAVAPTGPYDTAGATVVFLSGASAPDNFLAGNLAGLLKSGFYSYTAGSNYRAFLGETISVAPAGSVGFPTNQKILFIKRSEGGSVFGVNPIAKGDPIKTMILNATVCPTAAVAGGAAASCNSTGANSAIVGIDPGFAGAPGAAVPADFGVSDVAPFMFKGPFNVEFGQLQLTAAEAASIPPKAVNTLMQGLVTTKDVPETLLASTNHHHAMFTANLFDWNQIASATAQLTGKTQVVVCRRVPGSGTQASYNWFFSQFPCTGNSGTSGVSGFTVPSRMTDSAGYGLGSLGTGSGVDAANAIGVDVTAGFTVIENSGSGDVRTCLRSAALNLDYTFKDEAGLTHKVNFGVNGDANPTNAPGVLGWRAIGTLSLDSQVNTSTTAANGGSESAWFFRPLNGNGRFYSGSQSCLVGATLSAPGAVPTGGTPATGFCPNRDNLRTGFYDFASELTMQYKSTLVGAKKGFVDAFIARAGDPSFQALWTAALPGGLVAPDGVNAVSYASRQGNQCNPLIRQP